MRNLRILITFLFLGNYIYPLIPLRQNEIHTSPETSPSNTLVKIDSILEEDFYLNAVKSHEIVLTGKVLPSAKTLKEAAIGYSVLKNAQQSTHYLESYLLKEFNTEIMGDTRFDPIRETPEFRKIKDKYTPEFTFWAFIYLYVSLIGFFTAIVLQFNKKIDFGARILIGGFILIHSFFILHICLNITNYQYEFPHSYLMSTVFSFLYGPLLYFYFKRITQQYTLTYKDLLHLVPTFLFVIYITPTYLLTADEKLDLMLQRVQSGLNPTDSPQLILIVALKLISLVVYGYFIRKLYLKSKNCNDGQSTASKIWQRNLYYIHFSYVICYAAYGFLISNLVISGYIYHSQIICMALMVIYIGYSANVQANVFSGIFSISKSLFKYEKSGLTTSLSKELKNDLLHLLDSEKIYRENYLNLGTLAEKLNTTRHNTSQVINEHFDMNFHELINKYRIDEAKYILNNDLKQNMNIIDIAYEVGYNNKVTFNKAFKKDTQLTPSQYQRAPIQA